MQRVTVKTSTIFIAKGAKTRVYRSVQDVPPQLRKELEHSTNGFNSATILIADRRGREEIDAGLLDEVGSGVHLIAPEHDRPLQRSQMRFNEKEKREEHELELTSRPRSPRARH